jgi:hypothetical protein
MNLNPSFMHYSSLSVRIAIVILLLTKAISAQVVTIPYNPDVDSDSLIGSSDLLSFLPIYGSPFTPNAVLIDSLQWDIYVEQNASADTSFPQGSLNSVKCNILLATSGIFLHQGLRGQH